ncbi:MAG TPA: hypothetical protein PKD78_14590, partial [Saprospiraceae bacterium]|nr:hypothetical protein [Saprospiraceae bacterium]
EEYEQILIDFPDDLWAKNGHAELLKLEGNYDQSLIRYAQIKNDFPLDPVAFTSYAEVLKLQGKWQEAKAEFLKVRDLFKYDVWAPTGYAEILRAEGNWKEAKSCYVEIIRSFPHNQAVRHAYFSLLLFLGESTDEAPSLPKQPQTEQDYYWVHFHIKRMMWKGQWEEAKKLSDWALKHCPFAVFKGSFRRIRQCIRLQAKEFAEAVKEFNESPDLHPVSHLLAVQALAEVGEQERAYIELTFCKQFAENKIIYDPLCLLSERYQINGLPQKGYSKERLDQEIPPALLIAVIQQD